MKRAPWKKDSIGKGFFVRERKIAFIFQGRDHLSVIGGRKSLSEKLLLGERLALPPEGETLPLVEKEKRSSGDGRIFSIRWLVSRTLVIS